jgi:ribonuclease HI
VFDIFIQLFHMGLSFIAGATHFFPHTFDVEDAELMACRRALLLAKEVQLQMPSLKTDSVGAAAKLNKEGSPGHENKSSP